MPKLMVFPPFSLDPANGQLWRGKRPIRLRRKTFEVMQYLVDRPGQLITKKALLDALWADVAVSDSMPAICIAELRKALGDEAYAPQFIETAHGRGYRFIAKVTRATPAETRLNLLLVPTPVPIVVGREEELAQMRVWFARASEGLRQIVFVAGEPGIGKTTFVRAFLDSLPQNDDVKIGYGQSVEQYGIGEPYMPVLAALTRLGGESKDADFVEILNRLAPTWLAQMPALLTVEDRGRLQSETRDVTQQRMLREMAEALENPDIQAIFSMIGGVESVRILSFVNPNIIREHPKIIMGFSDTTIILNAFIRAGTASFYGPSILCDLAETGGILPFVENSIKRVLFDGAPFELEAAEAWTEEFLDWSLPENQSRRRRFAPSEGWVWLQGKSRVTGRLVGGCLEVLEFLKGTRWWIPKKLWDGAIFFVETSEETPSPNWVGYWLRNYGSQGILQRLSGILLARPMNYSPQMIKTLYAEIRRVLAEFGREDMPVVANMDFGHTSPQMVIPIGCRAAIDPEAKRVVVLESSVT